MEKEGPTPGWHSEAPTLQAGPGGRRLAGGGSDRSYVTRPPDPAPGPLKHFQARLGTPCAELRISSPSGSTDRRSQSDLANPPGPAGPGARGGFCGKPPPGDSRSLLGPPAPPPPGDSGLLLTTVQPRAAWRPAPGPALARKRSGRRQRQRLSTGSLASERQGGRARGDGAFKDHSLRAAAGPGPYGRFKGRVQGEGGSLGLARVPGMPGGSRPEHELSVP